MNVHEYKAEMRLNRGKLTKFDEQMEFIFNNASGAFAEHVLKSKDIGLDKAVHIVDTLTNPEQVALVEFITLSPRRPRIHDIDLKVIRLVSDR